MTPRFLADENIDPDFAHERVAAGQPMSGVFVLPSTVSMAVALDDLAFVASVSCAHEWVDRIVYLPLR